MDKKKTPVLAEGLAAKANTGVDEAELLSDRIARYGQAHARALLMLEHLRQNPDHNTPKASAGLASCGNYLHFREYYTVGKVRLHRV